MRLYLDTGPPVGVKRRTPEVHCEVDPRQHERATLSRSVGRKHRKLFCAVKNKKQKTKTHNYV
jgi:hypothetical protein